MSRGSTLRRAKLKVNGKFDAPISSLLVVTEKIDEHKYPRKTRRKLIKERQRLFRRVLKKVQRKEIKDELP